MTCPRKAIVSLQDTPYYHVVSRCVRRAWLTGYDEYASRDYSHRKGWVLERLTELVSSFAIDVCVYAVMSNHYHLVLRVDRERALQWSLREVVARWAKLHDTPTLVERWLSGEAGDAERELAESMIATWRERLYDLSWFMRCQNEHLARRANEEDGCKGRFWEGRFKSQALLDDAGLLTAMVYVDLNPIRAGIARTPEESAFTSIHQRILELKSAATGEATTCACNVPLLRFAVSGEQNSRAIPFRLGDYIELVDWTGRAIHPDKRGAIDSRLPSIAERLNINRLA